MINLNVNGDDIDIKFINILMDRSFYIEELLQYLYEYSQHLLLVHEMNSIQCFINQHPNLLSDRSCDFGREITCIRPGCENLC